MTPTGIVTQFSIPTPNSGPSLIIYGSDNDLWFTEQLANKIARITTSGSITEYRVPSSLSGVTGITFCTTQCGARGGAWIAEPGVNKIGKFVLP
jgi:virginiamycin B lyase